MHCSAHHSFRFPSSFQTSLNCQLQQQPFLDNTQRPQIMSASDQPAPPSTAQWGPISFHGMRLVWSLQDPLESAISVMPENLDPEAPREPYFQQSSTGSNWHRISQEVLIESTVASVTVESADLSNWPSGWWLCHMEHADADDDDENSGDENSSNGPCPAYSELPPREYDTLVVEASDKPYVTIHDYITTVHPWLMSL